MGAATEDKWAWVKIGDPFPENPVRAKGEQNQFVALWYKDGRPFFGRAWNNGGFVECSFPHKGVELKGKDQLGGQIQVLVHTGDYEKNGYWYDWVGIKNWRQDHLKLVKCGNGAPILAPKPGSGESLLGNVFVYEERASISYDGKATDVSQEDLPKVLVPVRNFQPPLGVDKPAEKTEEGLGQKVVELGGSTGQELFQDIRAGDLWPAHTVSRFLKTKPGKADEEELGVSLWYKDGRPVLGTCWEDAEGKIRASFLANGRELTCTGSFQVLRHHNAASHGFEYLWTPWAQLKELQKEGKQEGGTWQPVLMDGTAPCIVQDDAGQEHMGKLEVGSEKVFYASAGKEYSLSAASCPPKSCLVLARRDFKGHILSLEPMEASFRPPLAAKEPHLSPSMEYSIHTLTNLGTKRIVLKCKCSDNRVYRVRPVFLFLDAGQKSELTIGRFPKQAVRKDKIVICYSAARANAKADPAAEWEDGAEIRQDGQVTMWLCKVGVSGDRAPSPVASSVMTLKPLLIPKPQVEDKEAQGGTTKSPKNAPPVHQHLLEEKPELDLIHLADPNKPKPNTPTAKTPTANTKPKANKTPTAKPNPNKTDKPNPNKTEKPNPNKTDKPNPNKTDKPNPNKTDKPNPNKTDKPNPNKTDKPNPKKTDKPNPDKPNPAKTNKDNANKTPDKNTAKQPTKTTN